MYNPFILLLFLLFQTVLLFSCGMDEDDITSPETTPYTFNVPSYFGQVPQPADNIATQEGVALGKKLFFDPILSRDFTISCSSCHHPDKAFSDGFPIAVGINCANYIISLFSDFTRMVTMQNLFHDGGYSSTGITEEIIEKYKDL